MTDESKLQQCSLNPLCFSILEWGSMRECSSSVLFLFKALFYRLVDFWREILRNIIPTNIFFLHFLFFLWKLQQNGKDDCIINAETNKTANLKRSWHLPPSSPHSAGICFPLPSFTPILPLCHCPFGPRSAPSSEVTSQCLCPTCELEEGCWGSYRFFSDTLISSFQNLSFLWTKWRWPFKFLLHPASNSLASYTLLQFQTPNNKWTVCTRAYQMPVSVCCSNLWTHVVVFAQGETEPVLRGYVTCPRWASWPMVSQNWSQVVVWLRVHTQLPYTSMAHAAWRPQNSGLPQLCWSEFGV